MQQPSTHPRRKPSAARLVGALSLAMLVLSACASTPTEEPAAADVRPPVTARTLAATLDLRAPRRSSEGSLLLEASRDERIALFPGTHIATVRGVRYETSERLREQGADVWIGAFDADVLRKMWQGGVRAGPSVSAVGAFTGKTAPAPRTAPSRPLTLDDLPPPPERAPSAAPSRSPAGAVAALTPAERAAWAVPLRRPWQYIVVHHSGTDGGNAALFHQAHRARGWDGLGYDFVIGNGNKSPDGAIEVGFRWKQQREGAHAGNDLMNQRGIGICLVGDFNKTSPTAAQMRSLQRLADFLCAYCNIPAANLRLHRDFRQTECPGKHFPRSFALHPQASIRGTVDSGEGRRPPPR